MNNNNNMDETSAYRPCVGIALINAQGLVWTGKRMQGTLPEESMLWQFPQGGIDAGETPLQAAFRELEEETGIQHAELIHELPEWLSYDLPPEIIDKARKKRYKGQRQKWFAMRYMGDESDIKLDAHQPREFESWCWRYLAECPDIVVPFKKHVYTQIVAGFQRFCA